MQMVQHCRSGDGSRSSTVFAMRDMAPHQNNPNYFYSPQQNKNEDAPVSWFIPVTQSLNFFFSFSKNGVIFQ